MSSPQGGALTRFLSKLKCNVDRFCLCCSLRAGVIFVSILFLVNASLAFAGEAALYMGLLSAVSNNAVGQYLPPGTKIEDYAVGLHGALIFLGLYSLITSILGFVAVIRKNVKAATGLYVMTLVDVVMGIFISIISWFSGSSFSSLLAQIPTFLLNVYIVIVVKSYRDELKGGNNGNISGSGSSRRSGGGLGNRGDLETGVDESDVDLEGGNTTTSTSTGSTKGNSKFAMKKSTGTNGTSSSQIEIGSEDEEEEEDGDLGRGTSSGRATRL